MDVPLSGSKFDWQTIDFLLNETSSPREAKRYFRKVLGRTNITPPRVINVDKNGCYIGAVRDLRAEGLLSETCKRRVSPGLGFGSYPTA